MVTMSARFSGKCRRCGRPIPPGAQMEWTREGGAFHLTVEECAAAPAVIELRGPQPEQPEDRLRVVSLLLGASWKSATSKRYEKLPHQYTLRKHWVESEFFWVVEHIRAAGYEAAALGRTWLYYDVAAYQYWTMGAPVPETILINRAVRKGQKKP